MGTILQTLKTRSGFSDFHFFRVLLKMQSVIRLSDQPVIDAEKVQRNSHATAYVSRAIREVPSAMSSVFDALGQLQRNLEGFVVYAKGGLCLVLAAMAVAHCIGNCKEATEINQFIFDQMSNGVLSPSDVDTTIMKKCDDGLKLMGISQGKDENEVTFEATHSIQRLNIALSKNTAFWKKLNDLLFSTPRGPHMDVEIDSMDVDISPYDEEQMFAIMLSKKSETGSLLKSLNTTLKKLAGFTLARSKLHMFEEKFYDCDEEGECVWHDALEKPTAENTNERKINAVAEILDISWKDGSYGCELDMEDLMPLKLENCSIFMMTIPALVKDLLFCLMSTPEQKSTKRVSRLALACAIANDNLSLDVRQYLKRLSPLDTIPKSFDSVYTFDSDEKRAAFVARIESYSREIDDCLAKGALINECMTQNPECLSNGLVLNFTRGSVEASPISKNPAKSSGGSGGIVTWCSIAAAFTVTVASSFCHYWVA